MADNGNDDWRNEFNQAAANRDPQGNGVNVNGNGRLDGDLEAGATDSSRQSQAGSTPPPNAQQARQGEDGREARARKANLQSGVFGLGGRLFGGVRKSLEASLPLLQEPNAGVVGGQEGVGRAAGGRPGDYGQRAQEEQKEDKISDWFNKMESKKDVLQKEGAVLSPTQGGPTNRFRSSRTSFGSNQSESLVTTEVGQVSSSEANVSATVPTTDPSAGGLAEHALYGMSPFSSPRTQGQ